MYLDELKGYITYEIENFFIIIQICADYCEVYKGLTNNKYKMVINTSYNLLSPNDHNNGDLYIKSDGFLGPYINIKHDGLTSTHNINYINDIITLVDYNITIEIPYVEPARVVIQKYIRPHIRKLMAEQQTDTSNKKYLKYKIKYLKLKKLLFK